jgi:hypothetical protein
LLRKRPRPSAIPSESSGAEVLAHLGVDPLIVDWARRQHASLSELWSSCPRPDWLLAIALGAGLPADQIARVARDLGFRLEGADVDPAALIRELGLAVDRSTDRHREAVEAERVWAPRMLRDSDAALRRAAEANDAEMALPGGVAAKIRRKLPYDVVRDAIYPRPTSSPFR